VTSFEAAPTSDPASHRVPGSLELLAGALLVATVVLHVVAMFPTYFSGQGSLVSQPDQAALYALLAASWALALAIGLTGPHRTHLAAAMAVGIALTELGFRVSDLGDVFRYGSSTAGAGLWVMEASWVVGAAAAGVAVVAARARHARPRATGVAEPGPPSFVEPAPAEPVPAEPAAAEPHAPGPETAEADPAATQDAHERLAWAMLVVVLAAVVAGAFLPPWDHAVAVSSVTGRSVGRNLGNAFSAPWQEIVGSVLAAAALFAVPAVSTRLRDRGVAAAAAVGSLLVLATQLVAAVVQVDEPVPPAELGLSPAQAGQLGLHISMQLTGWFTLDALAAYALFAAVMIWATLRAAPEGSEGGQRGMAGWPVEAPPYA
jgi:hypothetical protein